MNHQTSKYAASLSKRYKTKPGLPKATPPHQAIVFQIKQPQAHSRVMQHHLCLFAIHLHSATPSHLSTLCYITTLASLYNETSRNQPMSVPRKTPAISLLKSLTANSITRETRWERVTYCNTHQWNTSFHQVTHGKDEILVCYNTTTGSSDVDC